MLSDVLRIVLKFMKINFIKKNKSEKILCISYIVSVLIEHIFLSSVKFLLIFSLTHGVDIILQVSHAMYCTFWKKYHDQTHWFSHLQKL